MRLIGLVEVHELLPDRDLVIFDQSGIQRDPVAL
jgi:hypothetical protein